MSNENTLASELGFGEVKPWGPNTPDIHWPINMRYKLAI